MIKLNLAQLSLRVYKMISHLDYSSQITLLEFLKGTAENEEKNKVARELGEMKEWMEKRKATEPPLQGLQGQDVVQEKENGL